MSHSSGDPVGWLCQALGVESKRPSRARHDLHNASRAPVLGPWPNRTRVVAAFYVRNAHCHICPTLADRSRRLRSNFVDDFLICLGWRAKEKHRSERSDAPHSLAPEGFLETCPPSFPADLASSLFLENARLAGSTDFPPLLASSLRRSGVMLANPRREIPLVFSICFAFVSVVKIGAGFKHVNCKHDATGSMR